MLVRYFVTLQGCPSTCIVPLPEYSSVIIRSCSWSLRSMPMYQAQLNRTDFRSFASFAGVYAGPPRPRPPRPPPCACAPAGAAPVCCAKAVDGALLVRATVIATLVQKILRKTAMMIPPYCLVVRVTGGNLDHTSV